MKDLATYLAMMLQLIRLFERKSMKEGVLALLVLVPLSLLLFALIDERDSPEQVDE